MTDFPATTNGNNEPMNSNGVCSPLFWHTTNTNTTKILNMETNDDDSSDGARLHLPVDHLCRQLTDSIVALAADANELQLLSTVAAAAMAEASTTTTNNSSRSSRKSHEETTATATATATISIQSALQQLDQSLTTLERRVQDWTGLVRDEQQALVRVQRNHTEALRFHAELTAMVLERNNHHHNELQTPSSSFHPQQQQQQSLHWSSSGSRTIDHHHHHHHPPMPLSIAEPGDPHPGLCGDAGSDDDGSRPLDSHASHPTRHHPHHRDGTRRIHSRSSISYSGGSSHYHDNRLDSATSEAEETGAALLDHHHHQQSTTRRPHEVPTYLPLTRPASNKWTVSHPSQHDNTQFHDWSDEPHSGLPHPRPWTHLAPVVEATRHETSSLVQHPISSNEQNKPDRFPRKTTSMPPAVFHPNRLAAAKVDANVVQIKPYRIAHHRPRDSLELHTNNNDRAGTSSNTNTPYSSSKLLQLQLPIITRKELEAIPRTSRGRIALSVLNDALKDIAALCRHKHDQKYAHSCSNNTKTKPAFVLNTTTLGDQHYKENNGLQNQQQEDNQWYVVREHELRRSCSFFRSGESTARSILLILRSLGRLKQVPVKTGDVTYIVGR